MSSTIKSTQIKRQLLQNTSEQKRELSSKNLSELKRIKADILQSQAELRQMKNAEPAVNHIEIKSSDDNSVIGNKDQNRLYTRQQILNHNQIETSDDIDSDIEERTERRLEIADENEAAKKDDDFYQVQDRGNKIKEDGRGYHIDAYAPEHEKDGIRVSITANKAVISGSRKAKNEIENNEKKMSTNNFQTFQEEFSFDTPVVAEGMTRERDGDYIRFFIPKLGSDS